MRPVVRYRSTKQAVSRLPIEPALIKRPVRMTNETSIGRSARHPVDAPLMPEVSQQRGPASASRLGLQSSQLHADTGSAEVRGALVIEDATGEAGQDWREGGTPRALYHVPAGRSRDTPRSVRRHPAPHRPAQTEASPNMTIRLSNMRARHGIAMPGARPEQCHRTLRRPISVPTQRIAGMHVPRAPVCCQPVGIGARSNLLKELKWGIQVPPVGSGW